ncbi:MAG: ribosome maturation factor RimM [Deltaproteobacteria bacterium]
MDEGAAGFVAVGRVAGPHGVKGKVKVAAFSGDPRGMLSARAVRLRRAGAGDPGEREFEVISAQPLGGCAVFSLRGIASLDEAGAWTGAVASVRRAELPPAGEDEYYCADLVGCELFDPSGARLGVVSEVVPGSAHDWLSVRRGRGESLLPLVGAFIVSVDVAGRRIVASPPEGW